MPDSVTHDRLIFYTAPIVSLVVAAAGGDEAGLVVGLSYLIGGYWLSPDLDLESARIDERWGPLRFIWRPYAKIARHRSVVSHSGLSILLRVAYLIGVMEIGVVVAHLFGLLDMVSVNRTLWGIVERPWWLGWAVVGLVLSDAVHSLSDNLSTSYKRGDNGGHHGVQ